MNRTDRADGEKRIEWIKTGGGSLRLADGKIIKPNQRFTAKPSEIPLAFRDTIKPVDSELLAGIEQAVEAEVQETVAAATVPGRYEVRERGGGWYDVVDVEINKVMNDTALHGEDAEKLYRDLTDGNVEDAANVEGG